MPVLYDNSAKETTFKIYSSSAGSGKTYTLAKEYIKLALKSKSAWYFNHILAVTFTKAAAHEMKERVLKYLRQFSSDEPEDMAASSLLLSQVLEELQEEGVTMESGELIDEEELRRRASRTFKHIIHEYANFSVSTIDSFVQRIVAAFTEELGFPFNFEVNLESGVLLDAAVESMLQKANTEGFRQITEAIKSFALEKAEDGKSWNNIPADLADFGRILLNDQFHESVDKIAQLQPDDLLGIEKQIKEHLQLIEETFKQMAEVLLEQVSDAGLTIDDFPYKKSGALGYFIQVYEGAYFKEPSKRALDAVTNNVWTAKSAPKGIASIIEGISGTLSDCGQAIFDAQEKYKSIYFLFKEIIKQTKKMALLSQLRREIEDIQQESGKIHISEFNRKILEIVLTEPIPFIYERLGERYNHILIDEFQDTSTLQWHNFLPLIENALASGHFNLAVGDAKQSIYRFRGGEMDMIVQLHKKNLDKLTEKHQENDFLLERYDNIAPYIQPENLSTNYRSTQEVIQFNNAFFESVTQDERWLAVAPSLPMVYDEFFQQKVPDNPKVGGHVQLSFLEGSNEDELMFGAVLKTIEEAQAAGFDLEDIAVLCRKNKDARTVANGLNDLGIPVISSDSMSLVFSEAVNLVVSLMKVVQNPDNRLGKYEAIYLFYRVVLNKIPNTDENKEIKEAIESKDLLAFYDLMKKEGYRFDPFELQQKSLYDIAERALKEFHLFNHTKELDFIFRFLDVVLDFQCNQSTHLTDFLSFWEQKKESLSISMPEGQNAVRVMSVHKSKGLEFPVVIVPYCHWSTEPRFNGTFWADLPENDLLVSPVHEDALTHEQVGGIPLTVAPLRGVKALEGTWVANQLFDEKEKTFLESLNMLYVALTRPTNRLYLIVRKGNRGFENSVGNLLYSFVNFPELDENGQHTEVIYEGMDKVQKEKKKKEVDRIVVAADQITMPSVGIRLRHSAERLFDLETFEKSKDYGNKLHAAFAKVKHLNDIDMALAEVAREGLIVDAEKTELKQKMLSIINKVRHLFEVADENVKNEREILIPNGKPLRPDRVVREGNKITIVDYKTGSKSNNHKTQVRQYMDIYRDMGYTEVKGVLLYVESTEDAVVYIN